jgi:hypothetical protein
MARLANTANYGYVPLPEEAATAIGTYIALPEAESTHAQVRIFDPCAGEGRALELIADQIGISFEQRFGCEIHDTRFVEAQTRIANIVQADTLTELQSSKAAFVAAYLNPPFDTDHRENGGGRLEIKFLERSIEKGWVQNGGVVVIVVPQYVMAREEFIKHLSRFYNELQIFALPQDIRHYGEAVAIGVMRPMRTGKERTAEIERLTELLGGDLPILEAQVEPLYHLPTPQIRSGKKLTWRNANKATPAGAQQEVVQTGGAWASEEYRRARQTKARRMAPKFPLHPGQRVFRIAAGEINGRVIQIGGEPHVIKGSTIEEVIEEVSEKQTEKSATTETKTIKRQVPCIVAVSQTTGKVIQFAGADGIGRLLEDPAVSAELSDAVTEAAPPAYQLDMDTWLANMLGSIKPPKALPGYKPGILPMQQHVIAASVRSMTTHDEAWGKTPDSSIIAAEMGCGKSAIGTLIAHAMILKLTGQYREFEGA